MVMGRRCSVAATTNATDATTAADATAASEGVPPARAGSSAAISLGLSSHSTMSPWLFACSKSGYTNTEINHDFTSSSRLVSAD